MLHPIGRIYDDNIYIADAEKINSDGSVSFYSHLYNLSRGVLLEPDDANACGRRLIGKIGSFGFRPSFSIAVNCAFDYDIFEDKGFTKDIIRQLGEAEGCYVGVSGCGEQLDDNHMNKTMVFASFE
jgi:hypothetical protein